MSSLKHGCWRLYLSRILNALVLPKSSNCTRHRGCHERISAMNSSTTSSYSDPLSRSLRRPLYVGSSRSDLLSVPTSMHTGRHWFGRIPAHTLYSKILPSAMPMPPAPRSPRPKIRSPSVTTATLRSSASDGGARDLSASPTLPLSSAVMYTPCCAMGSLWYVWHASPTVGVYTYGMISMALFTRSR